MKKLNLLVAVCLSFSSLAFADTYKSYTYKDLSVVGGVSEEENVTALLSADRIMMTVQALVLQKKMSGDDRIKSIREIDLDQLGYQRFEQIANNEKMSDEEKIKAVDASEAELRDMSNVIVEIEKSSTQKCRVLKAKVRSGYMDENGKSAEQLNTWVKFEKSTQRCK